MRIESNGIMINCAVDGPEGAPWVTFVTGMTNDVTMWDDHVPALSRDWRLLRLDSRGHGLSDATPPPYSFPMLVGDVVGAWDALGIERSHLVGIGLGGMTAIATALAHPERVGALVPAACRVELVPEYSGIWAAMIEKSAAGGIAAIADITAGRWFPEAWREANPERMKDVREMILRTSLDGYHGCIRALLTVGFGDRLGELAMPALFVSGALDAVGGPPAVMEEQARAVQDGRHVSLPGAGHICNMANPRAFEDALGGFLAPL